MSSALQDFAAGWFWGLVTHTKEGLRFLKCHVLKLMHAEYDLPQEFSGIGQTTIRPSCTSSPARLHQSKDSAPSQGIVAQVTLIT